MTEQATSTSFWTIQKPSESISSTYKRFYQWQTVFSSKHWQVQKRYGIDRDNDNDFVILPKTGEGIVSLDTPPTKPTKPPKPPYNPSLVCGCGQTDCVICNELEFRLLVVIGTQNLVIAQAASRSDIIRENLKYLQHNVSPMLEVMESEERLKATLAHTSDHESQNALLEFVILKIRALVNDQQTSPNPENAEQYFRQHFATHAAEPILYHSPCALWKHSYTLGYLFITNHTLCFVARSSRFKLILFLKEIISLRFTLMEPFQQCISLLTSDLTEYYLVEFANVQQSFEQLSTIWKDEITQYVKKRCAIDKKIRSRHFSIPDETEDLVPTGPAIPLFANHNRTILCRGHTACKIFSEQSTKPVLPLTEGVLEVSFKTMYFSNSKQPLAITIPFAEMENITRPTSDERPESLSVHLSRNRTVVLSNLSLDRLGMIFQLFHLRDTRLKVTVTDSPPVVKFLSKLKPALRAFSFSSKLDWYKYMATNPLTPWMVRNAELLDYIRSGIPNEFRAFMWQISCGGFYYRYDPDKAFEKFAQINGTSESITIIDRDLNRTFPEHPYFQPNVGGLESLRKVLVAYS